MTVIYSGELVYFTVSEQLNTHEPVKVVINDTITKYYEVKTSQLVINRGGWLYDSTKPEFSIKYGLLEVSSLKTKEQKAAEESVAKAREALNAAENALKIVKEGSK